MNSYFDEARISLLFLRRIRTIEFRIHGSSDEGWSVSRQTPAGGDFRLFSELAVCSFTKTMESAAQIAGKDTWCIVIVDPQTVNRLPESSRRAAKHAECGLAALISSKSDDENVPIPEALQSNIFNTLPVGLVSDLPVHIHATFSLSGDRKSISIEEDAQSQGSKWNRSLLQDILPQLYLEFLDDLGKSVENIFKFWPQQEPPKRTCAELLCASFWEKLPQSSQHVFPKAKLITDISQHQAPQMLEFSQAVFDFLPVASSSVLTPLLLSLGVNLARQVPREVARHLKSSPKVQFVTGQSLRQLLKEEGSGALLLAEMAKNPLIWEVLCHNLAPDEAELDDLDGCYILPLADGSLAPLKLKDAKDVEVQSYYVASKKELELFDFASSCLVSQSTGEKLKAILDCEKFNLYSLRLCHVVEILKMKPTLAVPTPEADQWLTKFWDFWNGSAAETLPDLDGLDVDIFRATLSGIDVYTSPKQFHQLPAVIEPSNLDHTKLCDIVPGLYLFDAKLMPKAFTDLETSLLRENSFRRLIQALRLLAKSKNKPLETFLQVYLDVPQLEVSFCSLHPFQDTKIHLHWNANKVWFI
jgi:sacsin